MTNQTKSRNSDETLESRDSVTTLATTDSAGSLSSVFEVRYGLSSSIQMLYTTKDVAHRTRRIGKYIKSLFDLVDGTMHKIS